MPTYDYKCNQCGKAFVEIHSIKDTSSGCPHCESLDVQKTISMFAARTEQSFDKALTSYVKQGIKDNERFHKDDKFAANITGADDRDHKKKLAKVVREQHAKNERARKQLKRVKE